MSTLEDVGGDLPDALEAINVPSYAIDPSGIIRWVNPAAERIVGDCCGRQFTSVVAAEDTRRAREHFARKVAGNERVTDTETVLLRPDGTRVAVEISSVPLREDHRVVAIFGQISDVGAEEEHPPHPALTPRQSEILRLLAQGRSTEQIAQQLHLSKETVRNHIRRLFKTLGVHTRLEAVAMTRGWGDE